VSEHRAEGKAIEDYTLGYTNFGGENLREFRFDSVVEMGSPGLYNLIVFRGISCGDVNKTIEDNIRRLRGSNIAKNSVIYSEALSREFQKNNTNF